MTRQWTAIIERKGDGYVALCPELDIASQGVNDWYISSPLIGDA